MKAIVIEQPGGPEAMRLAEIPTPQPGKGEALIRIAAIGVNYIDVYHRNGVYPIAQRPFTPGMEAAGTVEAVGPDVIGFKPGDRVAYSGVLEATRSSPSFPRASSWWFRRRSRSSKPPRLCCKA